MLFNLGQFGTDPRAAITQLIAFAVALIVGIAFHEFSHAFVAFSLGDNTAKNLGRLTLNPLAHLDPAGSVMILLIGFGWGKPTPVNPNNLRNGPKAGMALVSVAGPISNFIMAALFSIPLKFGLFHLSNQIYRHPHGFSEYMSYLLFFVVVINILLGLFNLLPIAPLDGAKLAAGIFPGEMGDFFRRMEPYGPGILMGLILLSWVSPQLSVFSRVIGPLQDRIYQLLSS